MSVLTIALDSMGGDHGPPIIISGAIKALHQHSHLFLILCGDAHLINRELKEVQTAICQRIKVVHCQDVVTMEDKPSTALRRKKDSSMRRAIELVASGEADACVSAGNTGALFALAAVLLKTLPGIDRPALVSHLPCQSEQSVWLLDLGANISNSDTTLVQNAVMGSVLAQTVGHLGAKRGNFDPKVALLNVGEEHTKGHETIQKAADRLRQLNKINFIGYLEANDILSGKADVIVTDGFTGNVALKASEGIYTFLRAEIYRITRSSLWMKSLAMLCIPILKKLYKKIKPDQYNGASLIGLSGIVVKSHGNANANAVASAITQAVHEVEQDIPHKIKTTIANILLE